MVALTMGIFSFGAISISANESEERNVMVEILKAGDSNAKVDINVDGNAEVFSLPELEVGETKDIITESGKTITITKTESGLSINVDGNDIELPSVGGDMAAHVMRMGGPLHTANQGVQVIGDLTEEQVAIIKDAFAAAGVEKEVNFTKGHDMQFFSIDGNEDGEGSFEFKVKGDSSDVNSWVSDDGEQVKIIKLKGGKGQIHVKKEVIVIESEEDNQ